MRAIDPYILVHIGGKWQLVGHCHLRHDIRHFQLDRIAELTLTNSTFIRPTNFKFGSPKLAGGEIIVRALFDATVARWVHESLPIYKVAKEENAEGLLVTFKVRHEDKLFQWLFSWGAHLRILEPNSLRERLAQDAGRMQRNLAG